jgi:hypothetical protein
MSSSINFINIFLDILLFIALIWMVMVALRGLGGVVGRAINLVTIGVLILGLEHISRRLPVQYLNMSPASLELIHTIVAFLGFILLGFGFRKIRIMTIAMQKEAGKQ